MSIRAVRRSSLARAVLGLCLSTSAIACGAVADGEGDSSDDGNTMTENLPTSETAVRVALFGEGNKAPANAAALRVWSAWFIVETGDDDLDDNDVFVLDVVGGPVETRLLTVDGEAFPAADLDFGPPPADALVTEDSGGQLAQPLAIVLDADIDATTLTRLGDLSGTATLGLSSYLGFVPVGGLSSSLAERGYREGLSVQTTEADGSPSRVGFVPVATAAAQFDSVPSLADYRVR